MNTHKAAYWLALAVFGLALHSEYRHGSFPTLHHAADRAGFTVGRLAGCAERTVAMARLLTSRPSLGSGDLLAAADAKDLAANQVEMLREQVQNAIELRHDQAQDKAELLHDQTRARTEMIRALVEVRRAQFEQARSQVRLQFLISDAASRRLIVVRPSTCSRTSSRVAIISSHRSSDSDGDSD